MKLLCRHDYERVSFIIVTDSAGRYTVRKSKCRKCGKIVWRDKWGIPWTEKEVQKEMAKQQLHEIQ